MQAPTSERQALRKISIALSKFHRRGEHCSPALAAAATQKISPAPLRACNAGPYKQKIHAGVKILPLFQNFIVGASIARPPLPYQQTSKYPPHRCGPAMQAPTSERQGLCKNSIALSKFHRRGEHCSPALAAPAALKKSPPHPGAPCPHPQNAPFCRKNENSLKNLPHAANKLTLVSVTFHPRAFIINLSKHCLPRVQNGAAAWF